MVFKRMMIHIQMSHVVTFAISAITSAMVFAICLSLISKPKQIATVSISKLTESYIQRKQSKQLKDTDLAREVKAYAKTLEKNIKAFSETNRLIILPKEAVMVGAPDYTDVFYEN